MIHTNPPSTMIELQQSKYNKTVCIFYGIYSRFDLTFSWTLHILWDKLEVWLDYPFMDGPYTMGYTLGFDLTVPGWNEKLVWVNGPKLEMARSDSPQGRYFYLHFDHSYIYQTQRVTSIMGSFFPGASFLTDELNQHWTQDTDKWVHPHKTMNVVQCLKSGHFCHAQDL